MTDGEHSAENGSIHPITALPQGGEQGECEKTERGLEEWGMEKDEMWGQTRAQSSMRKRLSIIPWAEHLTVICSAYVDDIAANACLNSSKFGFLISDMLLVQALPNVHSIIAFKIPHCMFYITISLVNCCSRLSAFLSSPGLSAPAVFFFPPPPSWVSRVQKWPLTDRRSKMLLQMRWGVGRGRAAETQSPHIGCPLPPERKQETRGAAVLNNGPAPHQPGLQRLHSVPPLQPPSPEFSPGSLQGD